jgi:hypothetical protein
MPSEWDHEQKIVIRWQTLGQAEALIPALGRAYPIDDTPCFNEALDAIDEAERQVWDPNGTSKTGE